MSDKQATLNGGIKTTVGHCRKDTTTVYIGRSRNGDGHMMNTEIGNEGWLGNPYPKAEHGREKCVELFRADFEERLASDAEFRAAVSELEGETLGCYCQRVADDGPLCHGEVIAEHVARLNA